MAVKRVRRLASEAPQFGTMIATVLVGDVEKAFSVHRNLIVTSSDFFAKALNGGFQEKGGTVYLRDGDPEAFEIYLQWLYTARFSRKRTILLKLK